jgi:anti-sigma factor RsiW
MSAHVDERLLALVERRLAPAERARVLAHLDECPRCRLAARDLDETARALAPLPSALRALPLRPRASWPAVWARVRAASPDRRLWPQASIYLGVVTSFLAFVAVFAGGTHGLPASVTAGVALGPQSTQAATLVFQTSRGGLAAGTAAQAPHGAQPTLSGTEAIAPVPIPTPVPGP